MYDILGHHVCRHKPSLATQMFFLTGKNIVCVTKIDQQVSNAANKIRDVGVYYSTIMIKDYVVERAKRHQVINNHIGLTTFVFHG